MYVIKDFEGIRVMEVSLTAKPKRVIVQPARLPQPN
jgi:hypothetical protein